MLHKYRKTALIEAEQFDGSDEMISRYEIVDLAKAIEIKEKSYLRNPNKRGFDGIKER